LCGLVFVLAGLLFIGASFLSVDPTDLFPLLSPLARVGWGLIAGGVALVVVLRYGVVRLIPSWRAALERQLRSWVKHPAWLISADLWRASILALIYTALALAPHDAILQWMALPPDLQAPQAFTSVLVLLSLFVVSIVAIIPFGLVRLIDRRR
jgi:hypothetical protein